MFEFSCDDCPLFRGRVKNSMSAMIFNKCLDEGACWLGAPMELHPVEHAMRELGVGAYDITEQPRIVFERGELKPCPVRLNDRGKLVMRLARVLAMQRRRVRMQEFGFDDKGDGTR
jgi:hypothetical protein